jgi:N-acetylmuramoyl-L-alanine amidase
MRIINKIVIHCADTPKGAYFDVDDIRKWHTQERGWSDVGYHYIILLDGTIQKGREDSVSGAHVQGNNSTSIGICYIGGANGEDTRTIAQKASLVHLISTLRRIYTSSVVLGHKDFKGVTKACPCFDAKTEYISL